MDKCFEAIVPQEKVGLSPSCGSIVPLGDGRLMWVWGYGQAKPLSLMANFSSDEGRSWTDPVPLKLEDGRDLIGVIGPAVIRLASGLLGMVQNSDVRKGAYYMDRFAVNTFHISKDEGQSWSQGIEIIPDIPQARSEGKAVDGLIQLSTGRLILPISKGLGPTPRGDVKGCSIFGERFLGGFASSLGVSLVYYSDDQGQTWQRCRNEVFATLERGRGGIHGMGEPQVAELADGRLLMIANTMLGQLFKSYSEDGGETWLESEPTDLVLRSSPLCLKRIPDSNDVLVIWSQISPWEAMNGLYRHRLSCAVSKDGGLTWQHHKNLISLDDTTQIEPVPLQFYVSGKVQQPIDRIRYHRAPGPLRNDHPYCTFHNGKAIIVYGHAVLGDADVVEKTYGMDFQKVSESFGFKPRPGTLRRVFGNNKIHVVPIKWLYT